MGQAVTKETNREHDSGKQNAADKHSLKNKYIYPYHVFVNKACPFIKLGQPFSLSG
jgi:hypothetical protein